MKLHALDARLRWNGVAELVRGEYDEAEFWRLPRREVALAGVPALSQRAQVPAGVSAILRTDARTLSIEVTSHDEVRAPIDVIVDGEHHARLPLAPGRQLLTAHLPGTPSTVEVLLPQRGRTTVGSLRFDSASLLESRADERPGWIAYGSSITQGAFADGPADTWVRGVGDALGLRAINLGLGGECHLDQVVARYIRDIPSSLITMCIGINIQMSSSLSARTLQSAIIGFVATVRDGHPSTPLVVISPIGSPERERVENAVGLSLRGVRSTVESAAEALGVDYIDGLEIVGDADAGLLVDGLHPGSDGHRLMTQRIAARLERYAA